MTLPDPERPDDDSERDHAAEAEAVRRVLEWITAAGKQRSGDARSIAIARRAIGLSCFLYPEFYGSKRATKRKMVELGIGISEMKWLRERIRSEFRLSQPKRLK